MVKKYWVAGWGAFLLMQLAPIGTQAAGPVSIEFYSPGAVNLFGDQLNISVGVASDLQVKHVKASVEGREVSLARECDIVRCTYNGTLSLSGLAKGSKTVTVQAVDYGGNKSEAETAFKYDTPPVLSVSGPKHLEVLPAGKVRVVAKGTDDLSTPVVSVQVKVDNQTVDNVTGNGELDRTVDLSAYDGRKVELLFSATDNEYQYQREQRTIYISSNARLKLVDTVPGAIVDFDDKRLLYQGEDGSLQLKDRVTQKEEVIEGTAAFSTGKQQLTPFGVLFVGTLKEYPYSNALYIWNEGGLKQISQESGEFLAVNGVNADYVLFADKYLYHVGKGELITIDNAYNPVLGDNGSVFFAQAGHIKRQGADGQIASLAALDDGDWESPIVQGDHILYMVWNAIYELNLQTNEVVKLSPESDNIRDWPKANSDYQMRSGWMAFTKQVEASNRQIFIQSSKGSVEQATYHASSVLIDNLADDGTFTYSYNGKLYVRPMDGKSSYVIDQARGGVKYRNGAFYKVLGGSLFQVNVQPADTSPPEWPSGIKILITEASDDRIGFRWPAALDTIGVSRYRIYQDGQLVDSVESSALQYTRMGLAPGTAYTFRIEAEDAFGNRSTVNPEVTASTKLSPTRPDQTPPVWEAGSALAVTDVTYTSVSLHWQPAYDESGVSGYTVLQDGQSIGKVSGAVYGYTAEGLTPGQTYLFAVEAQDAAGNRSIHNPQVSVTAGVYVPGPGAPAAVIQAQTGFLEIDSVFELKIKADQVQDLYGFLLNLQYEPERFKLTQIALSDEFGVDKASAVLGKDTTQIGLAKITGVLLGQTTGKAGSPGLVTLRFTAKQAGAGSFTLQPTSSFANSSGQVKKLAKAVIFTVQVAGGDLDQDGVIGLSDLVILSKAVGKKAGDPGFNPLYDLNLDGKIDQADVTYLAGKVAKG